MAQSYDEMVESLLAQKRGSIEGIQQQIEDRKAMNNSFLDRVNLQPLAAFVDAQTGSRMAGSFGGPTPFDKNEEVIAKLQGALENQKNELADQSLGFAKNRAYMDQVDAQRQNAKENMHFDQWYKQQLLRERELDRDAKERASLNKAGEQKGKLLTTAEVGGLADIKNQLFNADEIYNDWKKRIGGSKGSLQYMGKKLDGYIPNTAASEYWDNLYQKAQIIGKALEGGKLTDVDYEKYVKMLPQPGDSEERALQRIANLKRTIQEKYNSKVRTFSEAGYDTGRLQLLDVPIGGEYNIGPDNVKVLTPEGDLQMIPRQFLEEAIADGAREVR